MGWQDLPFSFANFPVFCWLTLLQSERNPIQAGRDFLSLNQEPRRAGIREEHAPMAIADDRAKAVELALS